METTPFSLIYGEDLDLSIAIHPRVIKCKGKVVRVLEESDEPSYVSATTVTQATSGEEHRILG